MVSIDSTWLTSHESNDAQLGRDVGRDVDAAGKMQLAQCRAPPPVVSPTVLDRAPCWKAPQESRETELHGHNHGLMVSINLYKQQINMIRLGSPRTKPMMPSWGVMGTTS
jgi:hypothetical protein